MKRPRRLTGRFDLQPEIIEVKQYTGYESERWRGVVEPLRPGYYFVTGEVITGAAPKDFIKIYEYGVGRRDDPDAWPGYIAKVGHKWYPAESITEQLMTELGLCLGLRMAASKLVSYRDQIRFASRYFLRKGESLVHGAEIAAGYLADMEFVHQVADERLERDIFTFDVLRTAIEAQFPQHSGQILREFVRMIGFDALVGNNDRHLYNWGVIVHPTGKRPPLFSPIYDTARGLFWNQGDGALARFENPAVLDGYIKRAAPLIGCDGSSDTNHFDLISQIAASDDALGAALAELPPVGALDAIAEVLETRFDRLLSPDRRRLILRGLGVRFEKYRLAL